jgi:hypothetical protein
MGIWRPSLLDLVYGLNGSIWVLHSKMEVLEYLIYIASTHGFWNESFVLMLPKCNTGDSHGQEVTTTLSFSMLIPFLSKSFHDKIHLPGLH